MCKDKDYKITNLSLMLVKLSTFFIYSSNNYKKEL